MRYSIKTIDGSRFDCDIDAEPEELLKFIISKGSFFGVPFDGGTKYFNIQNVVSITQKKE